MKASTLAAIGSLLIASAACAGPEGFSGKVIPPCPQWYADNEWNVSFWGAYAFTANGSEDLNKNEFVRTGRLSTGYLEADDAWGGGLDAKYFFKRYFGIGIEGYIVDASRTVLDTFLSEVFSPQVITEHHESRAIGSVLGTFTFRYPLPCSRFAPYAYIGGGAIFGGGQRDRITRPPFFLGFDIEHTSGRTEALGQLGVGCEVRLTPHIGLISDFSWNVINGPKNNFGMVRSGINFAF